MRWAKAPFTGERTRTGFLWLPRCIDGDVRWLERATWDERFEYPVSFDDGAFWRPVKWVSE